MIYVFGKNGQVATELRKASIRHVIEMRCFSSQEVDFLNPPTLIQALTEIPPRSTVINASAYTQVDQAENDYDKAWIINAGSLSNIAFYLGVKQSRLIQLSTDYVYSGEKPTPYVEEDSVAPSSVYGQTKLEGESFALERNPRTVVLRTSWVFSAHGKNFVKTILRLGQEKPEIKVVADQIGGPTSAAAIAETCLQIARQTECHGPDSNIWGIYNYCGSPVTSWAEFATEILRQAGINSRVIAIPSSEYQTPVKRPANSYLNCEKLEREFGIQQPDWKQDLKTVIQELLNPPANPF